MYDTNPHIQLCLESSASLLSGLSPRDREIIIQHHSVVAVRKGGYLFREGEKARGLICLTSGKAKVYRTGIAGREHIIKMLRVPDFAGFQSLFTESSWFASAAAIEGSTICIIEKQAVMRVIRSNPDLSLKINQILAEELNISYDKMVSLTQKHVRGRLVESLLMLGKIYGFEDDGITINACLSRSDLAHLSNMTTSNAIRTLSNLAGEGNLRIRGRKISLLNLANLEKISNQA